MEKIYMLICVLCIFGCSLFSDEGDLIYKQGRYSIYKKNLISYYNASPDLIVATGKGNVKINLNGFGRRTIPQEKINTVSITEISNDSIQIHFTTTNSSLHAKEEFIYLNVQHAIDSILSMKK